MSGRESAVAMLACALLLAGCAVGAQPPVESAADGAADTYRISVNVGLVVLQPSVRDRNGQIVSNLQEQDFEVYEDGVRQQVHIFRHEDIPVTIGLVVDHSASMGRKITEVIAAARAFVRASNPNDEMFVVNFNEKVAPATSSRFSNRADELERAILDAPVTGQTALYDAIVEARERLQKGTRERRALVVISDGGDNASRTSQAEALRVATASGAVVYTVGIFDDGDGDRNPDVLRRLSRTTGGEAFFPATLLDVVTTCERIAHDIRNQYTIGYVSTGTSKAGTFRNIRVVAGKGATGKLTVRTRTGYVAGETDSASNGLTK